MTDRLTIYNEALGHLSERRLLNLNVNSESRRVLDDYWDNCVAYCLERKLWNFAYRTVQIDRSDTVSPAFGYSFAFTIPTDWIRTRLISASAQLKPPLLDFKEEAGYWFANVDPIFVQYNSNDPLYGMNLGGWPATFADYVALRLARLACKRITGKDDLLQGATGLVKVEEKACRIAAAICAMNDPIGFAPAGAWLRSRHGFGSRDDNPGGSLMG